MTHTAERRPPTKEAAPATSTLTDYRSVRLRRRVARELDLLLAPESCSCCACRVPVERPVVGDPYHDGHLDLDVQQRDARGRELAEVAL